MNIRHKSSSIEQENAEKVIIDTIEREMCISFDRNRKIYLKNNFRTYICPDFYSETNKVIGEVYAHIGKMKPGQKHKITNDVLKMITFDKMTGIEHRKIIAVCDEMMEKELQGESVLAESIRQFGIEIYCVNLDDVILNRLIAAQNRQKMVNA